MEIKTLEKNKPSFLFISNWHPAALNHFKISGESYEEYEKELSGKLLDMPHLFASSLNKLGYRAKAIIPSCEVLQKKWARKNEINFTNFSLPHLARRYHFLRSIISKFPKIYYSFRNLADKKTWSWQILLAQIKEFKPDVLLIYDFHYFPPPFLKEARKYVKKIVGEISSPIMVPDEYLKCYDLLLSSLPHYVKKFRNLGILAAYLPYLFEPEILERVGNQKRKYDCVFIGILSEELDKYPLLEKLAKKVNIDFWGHLQPPLDKSSSVLQRYHGEAWGIDMFRILGQAKIAVNCHTKKIGKYYESPYANNVRLFEATGMGAMLITDAKENLGELFELGEEVETYNSSEELVEKINYYLKHNEEREKIALAGQRRTLKDHTYEVRAKKLLEIINYTL